MTGFRESQLLSAVDLLLGARRTFSPIPALPAELVPTGAAEAFFIQDRLAEAYGPVGGWKVGAPGAEAEPLCAPMPAAWMGPTETTLAPRGSLYVGLEAEVAFLLGEDLPPRAARYTDAEVYAAVRSCHPAIEIVTTAYAKLGGEQGRWSEVADLQVHGGFVYGPACARWRQVDFAAETVTLLVDSVVRMERTGSNPAGDLRRLLPWLANEGASRTGGLRAGQWVTTGSWTGCTSSKTGATADAEFATLGRVSVRFG